MPFIARSSTDEEGGTVLPEEVEDGTDVVCPACGGTMRPRGPFDDGRARHFYHVTAGSGDSTANCSGGESDPHRKMKSLAVSALRQRFDQYVRCGPEVTVDVPNTPTLTDFRRADALVEFPADDENDYLGRGLIVEVQYANEDKDLDAVTHDYLSAGYSVYWASPDDFTNDRFRIEEMVVAFDKRADTAFAASWADPPEVDPPEEYLERFVNAESLTFSDPNPDCNHTWKYGGSDLHDRDFCKHCRLERWKDTAVEAYIYDESTIKTSSDLADRAAQAAFEQREKEKKKEDHQHVWEPRGENRYRCRCGARLKEHNGEEIISNDPFEDFSEMTTTDPQYCDHIWEREDGCMKCISCGLEDPL